MLLRPRTVILLALNGPLRARVPLVATDGPKGCVLAPLIKGGGAEMGPGTVEFGLNGGAPEMTGAVAGGVGTGITVPGSMVTPPAGKPPGRFVPPVTGRPGSGTKTAGALPELPNALGLLKVPGAGNPPTTGLFDGCNRPGGFPEI